MFWDGLEVVWGGLEVVWGGLGCFGVVWGVSTDRFFEIATLNSDITGCRRIG